MLNNIKKTVEKIATDIMEPFADETMTELLKRKRKAEENNNKEEVDRLSKIIIRHSSTSLKNSILSKMINRVSDDSNKLIDQYDLVESAKSNINQALNMTNKAMSSTVKAIAKKGTAITKNVIERSIGIDKIKGIQELAQYESLKNKAMGIIKSGVSKVPLINEINDTKNKILESTRLGSTLLDKVTNSMKETNKIRSEGPNEGKLFIDQWDDVLDNEDDNPDIPSLAYNLAISILTESHRSDDYSKIISSVSETIAEKIRKIIVLSLYALKSIFITEPDIDHNILSNSYIKSKINSIGSSEQGFRNITIDKSFIEWLHQITSKRYISSLDSRDPYLYKKISSDNNSNLPITIWYDREKRVPMNENVDFKKGDINLN